MAVSARRRRMHVVLPDDLLREIAARVGPRRRSEFILHEIEETLIRLHLVEGREREVAKRQQSRFNADTLDDELRRCRLQAAIAEMDGALAGVEIPGWETPESAAAWVRAVRDGDETPSDDTS